MATVDKPHPSGKPQLLESAAPVAPLTWNLRWNMFNAVRHGVMTQSGMPMCSAMASNGVRGKALKHLVMSITAPAASCCMAWENSTTSWILYHICLGLRLGMLPSKVWGTNSSRYLRHCLERMLDQILYTNEKIVIGLYCDVVLASGTLARAATTPVMTCVGHMAPCSTAVISEKRSAITASGRLTMSFPDTPSGPTAAVFFFLRASFLHMSTVMAGNSTLRCGRAACMNATMVSHLPGRSWSGLCHLGAHSSLNWWMMDLTSPTKRDTWIWASLQTSALGKYTSLQLYAGLGQGLHSR